jgi:hypothetical protein
MGISITPELEFYSNGLAKLKVEELRIIALALTQDVSAMTPRMNLSQDAWKQCVINNLVKLEEYRRKHQYEKKKHNFLKNLAFLSKYSWKTK